MAHNKHYNEVTLDTLPDGAVRRASRVRNSVVDAFDKVDKVLFSSRMSQKKFNSTVGTVVIAKEWLKRGRNNINDQDLFKMGPLGSIDEQEREIDCCNKCETEVMRSECDGTPVNSP